MVLGEDQVAVELVELEQVQEVMLTVARVALVEVVYQIQLQEHLSLEPAVAAVEHSYQVEPVDPLQQVVELVVLHLAELELLELQILVVALAVVQEILQPQVQLIMVEVEL